MTDDSPDRAQFFRDLYELASSDLDTAAKLQRAIEIGRNRLDVDNGVLSYTGEGAYEVVATNITTGPYAAGSTTELGTTWCRHVVADRDVVAIADAGQTDYRDDVAREATGLECYLGVPVTVDGETYGTLCYSSTDPRASDFTERERQFVVLLADWVGTELERAKHYRELRQQNERLDEFVGVVAHDLRNPLAGAIGYTELAQERASGELASFLDRVAGALDRMNALIGECLALAKQGTDIGERNPVNLAEMAQDAWTTVPTGDATLELTTDATVYADTGRLQQLLENLFRNAAEHCQRDVTVTVFDTPQGFGVRDDGPGLPGDVATALTGSDDVDDLKELGLGLLIVSRIVNGHDWTLTVSADESGTTYEFSGVNAAPPVHEAIADANA